MNHLTRLKVAFMAKLTKGDNNRMRIGTRMYGITDHLEKRLRLLRPILGIETFLATIVFRLNMRKYESIPFEGANGPLLEGLNITFQFIFGLFALLIATSLLILPSDLEQEASERFEEWDQ